MKIAEGFVLKNIAGTNVVVPVGTNTVSFKAVITLNETGAFLWQQLENDITEADLLKAMLSEYAVDEATAKADIAEFIENLKKANLLA
ncbi:MAG: PqqD family protein [Clostridia bacterium]|nr:PqqD family protein [Clostridia bacterium]